MRGQNLGQRKTTDVDPLDTDTNKNLHILLGIIDHGSRVLLHLKALSETRFYGRAS